MRNIASIYPEWNLANITNYCGWTGITCNAAGNVTVVCVVSCFARSGLGSLLTVLPLHLFPLVYSHLRTDKGVPNLIGKLPASIANLQSLEKIDIAKQYFVGDLPAEIFLLPNITEIVVTDTALNIHFPTQPASRSIRILYVPLKRKRRSITQC